MWQSLSTHPSHARKRTAWSFSAKILSVEKGEQRLFDDIVYFFYLTNKRDIPVEEIDLCESNERGNQENLIAQLKSLVHALVPPSSTIY